VSRAAGVVLAGGGSTRFGRDKLVEPYEGVPMLHHAVLRLAEVCSELVVVIAPGAAEPPLPDGVPVRIARDPADDMGPLAGVAAGLAVVGTELAFVTGGDMPDVQTRVLLEMLRRAEPADVEAVALEEGGGARPLPLLLRVAAASELAGRLLVSDRRRLRDLLAELRTATIAEPEWRAIDPRGRTLVDVDEPADLER
jgi:molybdopterin-guanine dinucleotide biosynthesis protein A